MHFVPRRAPWLIQFGHIPLLQEIGSYLRPSFGRRVALRRAWRLGLVERAPTGRQTSAQGNALGTETKQWPTALKGRHGAVGQVSWAPGPSRPHRWPAPLEAGVMPLQGRLGEGGRLRPRALPWAVVFGPFRAGSPQTAAPLQGAWCSLRHVPRESLETENLMQWSQVRQ